MAEASADSKYTADKPSRWDEPLGGRRTTPWVAVSVFAHVLLTVVLVGAAYLARDHKATVPVVELVDLQPPKIRPLQPKVKPPPVPPPPEPEPVRPPDAPKLTPKPKVQPTPPKEPKTAKKEDVDTTRKVSQTVETQEDAPREVSVSNVTDPRLRQWISRVKKKADLLWNPPGGIDIPPGTKVKVAFTANRDGSVEDIRLAQTGGSAILDENALATIQRMGSTPPIPPNFPDDRIEVAIEFPYR